MREIDRSAVWCSTPLAVIREPLPALDLYNFSTVTVQPILRKAACRSTVGGTSRWAHLCSVPLEVSDYWTPRYRRLRAHPPTHCASTDRASAIRVSRQSPHKYTEPSALANVRFCRMADVAHPYIYALACMSPMLAAIVNSALSFLSGGSLPVITRCQA